MSLKLDKMESDLVLACKHHYGNTGVEKVVGDYCGYDPEHCNLDAKYHFVSELLMKLIETGHLRLSHFLDELSPRHIDGFGGMDQSYDAATKVYNRMVSMIFGLKVAERDSEGNYYTLVELHELNEKFKDKEKCKWCSKELKNEIDDLIFKLCEDCNNRKLEVGE